MVQTQCELSSNYGPFAYMENANVMHKMHVIIHVQILVSLRAL